MMREETKFSLEILSIPGIPEIKAGDDLAGIIFSALKENQIGIKDGDIFVIAQKVVSKAEGCVHKKNEVSPSSFALEMSNYTGKDPACMELVLRESKRIVRMAQGFIISQTHHGFVMANSGVDSSNSGNKDCMITLPVDPDKSARFIKERIEQFSGKRVAVIISDTFGRPWRNGQVNMAIGVAGIDALADYRGMPDCDGREMNVTQIAVVDEMCSAAELVTGKTKNLPAVVIRNYPFSETAGTASDLVREEAQDLFR